MKYRKVLIMVTIFVLIISLVSCKESEKNSSSSDDKGNSPSFSELTIDDGDTFTAEEIKKNKLTVLNVWATWCPPCIGELPYLHEINQIYKDKGVEVVGVLQDGVDDNFKRKAKVISQAETLLNDAKANYRIILPNKDIVQKYIVSMQFLPTTYMLNSEGEIIDTIVSAKSLNQWRDIVESSLEKVG